MDTLCSLRRKISLQLFTKSSFRIFRSLPVHNFCWCRGQEVRIQFLHFLGFVVVIFYHFCKQHLFLSELCGSLNPVYCKSTLLLLAPLLFMVLGYIFCFIYVYFRHRICKRWDATSSSNHKLYAMHRMSLLISIILMFYIYISVCRGIYDLMHCRKLGPQGYFLYGDLETQCYTPSYYTWALGLGIPGFLLYVIGIPVMFSLILFLNRHQLTDPKVRRYLGILYNGYKLRYYWWEVITMLRKVQ